MIIRVVQNLNKETGHKFITEAYNDRLKKWSPIEKCHYHYKDAKVRIKDDVVFLVGHSVDTDQELSDLQVDFLAQVLDWNDDSTIYRYVNWVNFFEAYH